MKLLKRFLVKLINNLLKDEILVVGSLRVTHKDTLETDRVRELTPNAGVEVQGMRPDSGNALPASPTLGQLFYLTGHAFYASGLYLYTNDSIHPVNSWFDLKKDLYLDTESSSSSCRSSSSSSRSSSSSSRSSSSSSCRSSSSRSSSSSKSSSSSSSCRSSSSSSY